ncbi:MAG TPA: hypothetical protein PLQ93_12605, partial [Bacteroidia bacterium]|nr:hypothetical protein [Bacteroidia bacterium]
TVPFILASVTVLIILLFLSLCDPKPHHGKCECKDSCSKECMEACERGDHKMHHEGMGAHKMNCGECKSECTDECMDACMKGDHSKHHKAAEMAPAPEAQKADSAAAAPAH